MRNMKIFSGKNLTEIAFPIGGIGTGSISIGGWGNLRDFEIMNRPAKGFYPERTFFTIFAKPEDETPQTHILQGPVQGSFNFPMGYPNSQGAGLPHFTKNNFCNYFPFAIHNFFDLNFPLSVSLETFNPFIPLNPDDSGIPIAIFSVKLKNKKRKSVSVSLAFNCENFIGYPEKGGGEISFRTSEDGKLKGLFFTNPKYESSSPKYGSMAITSPHINLTAQTHWRREKWFDSLQAFWDIFSESGELEENYEESVAPEDKNDIASICLHTELEAGETKILPIFLSWHFPNFEKYFNEDYFESNTCNGKRGIENVWKNYYTKIFSDAFDVAQYAATNFSRLEKESRMFSESFFSSTLPVDVLDAISANLSTLKTTTCIRLKDGSFYAFEGCYPDKGCCHGTCSHVWNYAQAPAYLFPTLQRKLHKNNFHFNMDEDGHINFRTTLPLCKKQKHNFHAATDGQMGSIIQVYREWLLSGDNKWLKSIWEEVKKALEYAWKYWDYNKDGVMEGVQHNTYDIEFHGPNPMTGTLYLCALRAAEKLALHLGETDKASKYRMLYEKGSKWIDKNLFNGSYYIQKPLPDVWNFQPENLRSNFEKNLKENFDTKFNIPKYQIANGCLSDQLIGEWYSSMLGLSPILNESNIKKALKSIFINNWKKSLNEHCNCQRIYAVDNEPGLLLCSWRDKKDRPGQPFPYSDEVWTGIEYQVAAHLIYYGFIKEGLEIVSGVRKRYDGEKRNPFNEIECGNHYARGLSSYSLILALSSFYYSATENLLQFSPRTSKKNFKSFFSTGSCWGILSRKEMANSIHFSVKVNYGDLTIKKLKLDYEGRYCNTNKINVVIGKQKVDFKFEKIGEKFLLVFPSPIKIRSKNSQTSTLKVVLKF